MPEEALERSLEIAGVLRDPTRLRLYRYIERQPGAVGRDEAATAVGVSRSLAAFHLEKLVAAGLLRPEYRRLSGRTGRGAGRTSKLYRRSARHFELSVPERRHELLARLLAESTIAGGSGAPDSQAAHELGRSLGKRARRRLRGEHNAARLLDCVEDLTDSLGFDPYRDSAGAIRLRNCPFDPLSRRYTPLVCGTAQAILTGVVDGLGTTDLEVSREMDPERCCGIVRSIEAEAAPACPSRVRRR
jgi:predicted ArsR family transcriptional regulator